MSDQTPTTETPERSAQPSRRRDIVVAASCGAFVAMMVGMAYAAVPLYDWFCRATGFGGTPQVATAGPAEVLGRTLAVRFDSNVGGGLPWRFEAERVSMDVKIGDVVTVHYTIINESARATAGVASYNVTPPTVGAHFNKINCFCFSEQTLKPGERREMAVVFFIDPAIVKDAEFDDLKSITLSYTMHPVRQPERPVADNRAAAAGRI